MSRTTTLKHEFIEFIPENLEEGTLYVSLRFGTAVHLCCCGCRSKVVTPLRPTDWQLIFDGKTVSLYPSIGNWGFPCRSHYWIRQSRVVWAPAWSKAQVKAGRALDRKEKDRYFGKEGLETESSATDSSASTSQPSWWHRLTDWLRDD